MIRNSDSISLFLISNWVLTAEEKIKDQINNAIRNKAFLKIILIEKYWIQ